MKEKLYRALYRYQLWMQGRNGFDSFSRFLIIFGWILTFFARMRSSLGVLFYFAGEAAMIFSIYRCYSKNLGQRRRELEFYNKYAYKVKQAFYDLKAKSRSRKNHEDTKNYIYIDCAHCNTRMRVPKGNGTIIVTCPTCKSKRTIYS